MLGRIPEPLIPFDPPRYICKRAQGPVTIDGDIDKAVWQDAPWTALFADIEGPSRPAPRCRTRAKMLWDEENLYIAAELMEEQIWATLTERDCVIFQDNDFEVFIDPYLSRDMYYEIEINALNTVWDLLLTRPYRDGGRAVNGFDVRGLRTAVKIDGKLNDPDFKSTRWTVEMAFPWKAFSAHREGTPVPGHGKYWRIAFSRVEHDLKVEDGRFQRVTTAPRTEHNWTWPSMGVINMHTPEMWAFLLFDDGSGVADEIPACERVKWELRRMYYRQRAHYAQNGAFTDDAAKLCEGLSLSITPQVEATTELFQITALCQADGKTYAINQYGNCWVAGE